MYQFVTRACVFEKQISNPVIEISVDINHLIIIRNKFELHTIRNVNQNVTNPGTMSEEMPVVAVIPVMVVNKDGWLIYKTSDYMPIIRMLKVVFVMPV